MIILKIWLLGSLSYPIIDLRNRRSQTRGVYYLRGSLIIMQDDATPTDTTPSQKRETPEDAGAAQEPERRVRPRETPVGAGAAAAPEPEEEEEKAVAPPFEDRGAARQRMLEQMDKALTELPEGSEGQRAVLGTLVLAARDARNDVAAMEDADGDTVAVPPAPPRTAVRYWQIRGPSAAQRARWGPGNPFWDPEEEEEETAPRIFGSPPIDDNTPPDPWVREEFEVETGRVVHQETIEGEPPRRCCNH